MGLSRSAGVDFPNIAYQDQIGADIGSVSQVDGKKWILLPRDIQSSLHYLANRQLSLKSWLRSLRGCTEDAILAKDDLTIMGFVPAIAMHRVFPNRR